MTRAGHPSAATGKILVIGLGNPDRGDDGFGAIVAQQLLARLPPEVTVIARRGDPLSLIEDWAGFDVVLCVDAAAKLGCPGRVHRIEVNARGLPRGTTFASSHALGLAEAIELARALRLAPREILVYAVEGDSFDSGSPLTPAVAAAVRLVADRIVAEVGRLRDASLGTASHA